MLWEGNVDWIDINGGSTDLIGNELEVLGSNDIRAKNTGDPGGSDDGALPNGDADRIRVIDEDGTN
jgi:hypothetical protein